VLKLLRSGFCAITPSGPPSLFGPLPHCCEAYSLW
jgi:hypothetical protein